MSNIKMYT